MDIYNNRASEKFFIHVEDIDHGKAFFITPQGYLKTLNLFDYQKSMDEAHCLRRELIRNKVSAGHLFYLSRSSNR